ncbi:uncharacterized protein BDZ99DRAFT_569637 [Mytilinidion resinicola]|uniref:RING-type domain-containing protein n=1 Tax=Mytilinidion resinicola TaxID=574789 RepID=A0A6A6YUD7_9PEZI|nr:uncharacterized protein BDZ99DRAFT_569637 [Mytilinidion resinicola]KAF2811644.1 hypothetical protein BDZ99DRAFT_569637 [Mytilinidion resinicola]
MSSPDPPTRPATPAEFVANHLTALEINNPEPHECNICHEMLNANHPAVQITGIDGCHHIFGRSCLMTWIGSVNFNHDKCPMCRITLFGRGNELGPDGRVPHLRYHQLAMARAARWHIDELTRPRHRYAAGLDDRVEFTQLDNSVPPTNAALRDLSALRGRLLQARDQASSAAGGQQQGGMAARPEPTQQTTPIPTRGRPVAGSLFGALRRDVDEQQATAGAAQFPERHRIDVAPLPEGLQRDLAARRIHNDTPGLRRFEAPLGRPGEQETQDSGYQQQNKTAVPVNLTLQHVPGAPRPSRGPLLPRARTGPRDDLSAPRSRYEALRDRVRAFRNEHQGTVPTFPEPTEQQTSIRSELDQRHARMAAINEGHLDQRDQEMREHQNRQRARGRLMHNHAQLHRELSLREDSLRMEQDRRWDLEVRLEETQQREVEARQAVEEVRRRIAEASQREEEFEREEQLQREGAGLIVAATGRNATGPAELVAALRNAVDLPMPYDERYLHAQMGSSVTLQRAGMPSNELGRLHFEAYQHQHIQEEQWRSEQEQQQRRSDQAH